MNTECKLWTRHYSRYVGDWGKKKDEDSCPPRASLLVRAGKGHTTDKTKLSGTSARVTGAADGEREELGKQAWEGWVQF